MKVYFDNCVIQRPLDDKNQIRIAIEAEAVLGLVSYIESGRIILVSSDVLLYEIRKIPNFTRREYAIEFTNLSSEHIHISHLIEKCAQKYEKVGIKAIDALHIAAAEIGKVDYFCTSDDKFLKKLKKNKDIKIKSGNPIQLIEEIGND